jgi:hypothetical protein
MGKSVFSCSCRRPLAAGTPRKSKNFHYKPLDITALRACIPHTNNDWLQEAFLQRYSSIQLMPLKETSMMASLSAFGTIAAN